jgi:hypothetical protein
MAKGWTTIRTDRALALTKAEATKKAKVAEKVTKVKSLSYENLQKEGIDAHAAVIAREDSILAAKADKKLKSKALIKEAKIIEKRRNKKKGNAKDKAD